MSAEPPTLGEQFGYSAVSHNHAFSSLQRALRPHPGLAFNDEAIPRTVLHTYFQERYRLLASELPVHCVITALVELYFSDVDWYFISLDRCIFEELLESWAALGDGVLQLQSLKNLSRELQYFPALLFQVLAVTLQFVLPDTPLAEALQLFNCADIDKQSENFTKIGIEIMALLGRQQPAITSIEHDVMRLTWLKNCSRGGESWLFLSHAVRQAQLLGLHLEQDVKQEREESVESILTRLWSAEHKRRVWARIYMLDAFMSLILGRPRLINKDDCTVSPPLDQEFPANPSKTVFLPSMKVPEPSPTTFLTYLCAIATKIHELLSSEASKPHVKDYGKVQAFHEGVLAIQTDLPPALWPSHPDTSCDTRIPHLPKIRQQMISTANSFLMNLHRPHVGVHASSRRASREAALKVLDSQQAMFELMSEHQYRIYGFSFYTIDAGILLASLAIDQPPESVVTFDRTARALQQAMARLDVLGSRVPIATTGVMILEQCLPKIPRPPAEPADVAEDPMMLLMAPETTLQSAPLPSDPYHSAHSLSSYRMVEDILNLTDPPLLRLQSFSSMFDAGTGVYGHAANTANGASWVAPGARPGQGQGVEGYQNSPATMSVEGMDMFSYEFDENAFFFFNADMLD